MQSMRRSPSFLRGPRWFCVGLHAGVGSETAVDGQDDAGDSGSEVVIGQEQEFLV